LLFPLNGLKTSERLVTRLIRFVARFQRCATLPPLRYGKAGIAFTVLLAG